MTFWKSTFHCEMSLFCWKAHLKSRIIQLLAQCCFWLIVSRGIRNGPNSSTQSGLDKDSSMLKLTMVTTLKTCCHLWNGRVSSSSSLPKSNIALSRPKCLRKTCLKELWWRTCRRLSSCRSSKNSATSTFYHSGSICQAQLRLPVPETPCRILLWVQDLAVSNHRSPRTRFSLLSHLSTFVGLVSTSSLSSTSWTSITLKRRWMMNLSQSGWPRWPLISALCSQSNSEGSSWSEINSLRSN